MLPSGKLEDAMTQQDTIIDGVNYGPLACLIGTWVGEKGLDVSPAADGSAENEPYSDELSFTPLGSVTNACKQQLVSMRYQHIVKRLSDGAVFHDQIGHWIWEPATGLVMHSISIPRGVTLLAGGDVRAADGEMVFSVSAEEGSETYGINQSAFMAGNARTKAYKMQVRVAGDTLSYAQATSLHIYGKDFEHTDKSTLTRTK
jgi:hypothetical protein